MSRNWRLNLSLDTRYNAGYSTTATVPPLTQDSLWLVDAAVRLYAEDEGYELALIGRNLTDEIYPQGSGAWPGACPRAQPTNPNPFARRARVSANDQDRVVTTSLGATYPLQFRVRLSCVAA